MVTISVFVLSGIAIILFLDLDSRGFIKMEAVESVFGIFCSCTVCYLAQLGFVHLVLLSNLVVSEHFRKLIIVIVSCPERNVLSIKSRLLMISALLLFPQIQSTAKYLVSLAVQVTIACAG